MEVTQHTHAHSMLHQNIPTQNNEWSVKKEVSGIGNMTT